MNEFKVTPKEEHDEDNYFPSENYLKRNRKEIITIDERLVELGKQKKIV